jgi:hypothetical protein
MAKAPGTVKYTDRDRLSDYRTVFSTPEGKKVLLDLIARHYVLGSTFHNEPTIMANNEGQREVVLHILRYMQMKPSDIPTLREGMLAQFELEPTDDDLATGRLPG